MLEDKLQVTPTINTAALSPCMTLKTNTLPSGSQEKQQESRLCGEQIKAVLLEFPKTLWV